MKPHTHAPNGIFADGILLYGSMERGSLAARGYWIELPELRGASHERRNAFQEKVRAMLSLVTPGRGLQCQWHLDWDHRPEIVPYTERTAAITREAIRRVRNERSLRYGRRMLDRQLRRERLSVFLTIENDDYSGNVGTRKSLRARNARRLEQLKAQFSEFEASLRVVFGAETALRAMDDAAHHACLYGFLNPSAALPGDSQVGPSVDSGLTIQENCWHSDGVGQPDGGFVLDGLYHAVLVLSRWPKSTYPGIVSHLTSVGFLDYRITVNVIPSDTRHEVTREEHAMERLQGEYAEKRRHSLLVALQKKERKVENLAGGYARPFHVTYVLRTWDATREGLREKVALLKAAVRGMNGAQCFECGLPASAKKLFFASWPGWTHSAYRAHAVYAEDSYLADLLPFSATFTGRLSEAEALYDGSHDNLVGVATFAHGSPQHAVIVGMSGSGKSEFTSDLLLQTGAFFEDTLLIDEGYSYRRFAEAMGVTPIVVQPDSPLTLNYLDTQGLPLTQLQLTSSVALLSRMIGEAADPEKSALRQAQLAQYLHQLYHDTFVDWSRRYPDQARGAERLACAVHRWRERMPVSATPLEAFADLRDRRAAHEDEALGFFAALTEDDITRFAQEPATARLVAQTACAAWTPDEFPTHTAFVELLAYGRFTEHPKDEIDRLATLLRAWSTAGQYGKLFDGQSNLSLTGGVTYFELGLVPEQAVELKAAAGLLISGFSRQHILSLPRAQRKRIIFEELARFLDVPGGEKIVAEGYAQLRKFNCWVVSIVQQYARFKQSRVRPAVIGNAKQFFLLRQADRTDIADLAHDLGLPESAVEAIQQYPMPEQLPATGRYSSVCYFLPTAQPPQCGTLRHIQAA
ncbi:MAG: hypothetical protein Q8N18_05130 [Opitutaceae bacterium]|nr:hypothetical protein [Opitutaceae bacterium]